jgi:hypothetical protein
MDPDPAQDPTPDPAPVFTDFKDAKNNFFIFVPYNLPAGTLSSVFKPNRGKPKTYNKCFLEFNLATINGLGGSILSKKSQNRCALLNTFMRKGKDPGPEPDLDRDPYL